VNAAVLAPVLAVGEAHAVLHMALDAGWPECGPARTAVFTAVVSLGCALRDCQETPGAEQTAKAAEAADALIRVMDKHCGPGWGNAR